MGKTLELYIGYGNCTLIEVDGARRLDRLKGAYTAAQAQQEARRILETEDDFTPSLRIIDPTRTVCRGGEMVITLHQMQVWESNGGGAAPCDEFRRLPDIAVSEARRNLGCHLG